MGVQRLVVITISAIMLMTPSAALKAQDEQMQLKHDALAPHRRSVVTFPHALHEEKIDCIRCHHDFNEYGVNVGSEGEACGSCHGNKAGLPGLREAFHGQCIECHRKLLRKKLPTGPVLCADCHRGQVGAEGH
ncbi:cytochrome c3 family protein [Thermodesulforhabdus norvegica]|uniref:Class III cytochrome C family protein n=1 Tax=Thermodesulforhabdus norvegica TaxID=39841 RepID=A0A1I4QK41_9BACT|nr:cytochrome c3 family protein [Thermodesulforhabdus norvegica]SFM40468.1 Class III cytochrome C family protein [Thermodesulforhabdus norvegica]